MDVWRLYINSKLINVMFVEWRIESLWKFVIKKGIGKRMGKGKSFIFYYVIFVKVGRIFLEVGGEIEYK